MIQMVETIARDGVTLTRQMQLAQDFLVVDKSKMGS